MANPEHLRILEKGVDAWNSWRRDNPDVRPDLREADLYAGHLHSLRDAILRRSRLYYDSDQNGADLNAADEAAERDAEAAEALVAPDEYGWPRTGADFSAADFSGADLTGSNLARADLTGANLTGADLSGADLFEARLHFADLSAANFSHATLEQADLTRAALVETDLTDADLTGCRVYGISAWGTKVSDGTRQYNLVITPDHEPNITADDIEVAQFLYLMLHNERLRKVIDTISTKVVLILGRFALPERKKVLDALRDELRKRARNYVPVVFDFEKPRTQTTVNTVVLLARMSRFVIADLSDAKSVLLELGAIVPSSPKLPVQPIIVAGQEEPGMFDSFQGYTSFLALYRYEALPQLIANLDASVLGPAEAKVALLRA